MGGGRYGPGNDDRIVVIVAAALIGVFYFLFWQSDDGSEDDADSYYVSGDYVEWSWSMAELNTTTLGDVYSYQRNTVVHIDEDWITINRTYYDSARIISSSTELSVPANDTSFGMTTGALTAHGTDVLSTKWGNITADHYTWTTQSGADQIINDIWMMDHIVNKLITPGSEFNIVVELTDSNFDLIENL